MAGYLKQIGEKKHTESQPLIDSTLIKSRATSAMVNLLSETDTGGGGDTTAPTVESVEPSSGARGVSIRTSVTATFSEAMDEAKLTRTTIKLVKRGFNKP